MSAGDPTIDIEETGETGPSALRFEQACCAARIADDYRSGDVVVLDLTEITPIVDFFVIATGPSGRQIRAVGEEISRVFKAAGDARLGIEGYDNNSSWLLLDYGDIVVHVQDAEARELYDLEGLWADALRVEWQSDATARDSEPE
ncbi:MAG: ribosome silencing factor [Planctomycetaceae bacterium]